jgi:hypothetical protein
VGVKGALKGGNICSEKDKKLHEGLRVYMGAIGTGHRAHVFVARQGKML